MGSWLVTGGTPCWPRNTSDHAVLRRGQPAV